MHPGNRERRKRSLRGKKTENETIRLSNPAHTHTLVGRQSGSMFRWRGLLFSEAVSTYIYTPCTSAGRVDIFLSRLIRIPGARFDCQRIEFTRIRRGYIAVAAFPCLSSIQTPSKALLVRKRSTARIHNLHIIYPSRGRKIFQLSSHSFSTTLASACMYTSVCAL